MLLKDATDSAGADGRAGLANLLSDDVGRGVGVEEAVADDLLSNIRGAPCGCLGSGFATEQSGATALLKGGEELVIALLGVAVLGGGGSGAEAFTFALDEHGEFAENLVVFFGCDKGASRPGDRVSREVELHSAS